MAAKIPAAKTPDPKDDLKKDALERLREARRQKDPFEVDLREAYFFAAPHRSRHISSRTKPSKWKPQDAEDLNTSFAFELAGDFSTVIMNTFLPEAQPWAQRRAGMLVPDDQVKDLEEQAAKEDAKIFKAIGGSNFYAECGKGFTPDLALGTVAMWCDKPKLHVPMKWQSIPLRELEINTGPDGCVDDRFVVRYTKYKHVKAILKGVSMPEEVGKLIKDKGNHDVEVVRGFWHLHDQEDNKGEDVWQYVALVNGILVDDKVITGNGSCPLIVARFNPCVEWALGIGPLIQGLPDLRVVDELAVKKMKMLGRILDGPRTFPDDSVANFEEGVEDGALYPVRPGTAVDFKPMYEIDSPDPAIYFSQDLEARLKRLFFLDYPDQPGKTPPTATQWLDEMTMAQRRIGTPGLSFWDEFCGGVFMRAEYLLEKAGVIQPLKVNNEIVTLQAYNPAQQAYEQQKIKLFMQFAQIASSLFPEEWKVATDGASTMDVLAKMSGVEDIWMKRKDADVKGAIDQIKQLMGGTPPSAPNAAPQPPANPDLGPGAPNPQYQVKAAA